MEKTALETTESVLNHLISSGKAEDSDPRGTYSKAYSEAFTLVAAAQSVVRAEQNLQRITGAYKAL